MRDLTWWNFFGVLLALFLGGFVEVVSSVKMCCCCSLYYLDFSLNGLFVGLLVYAVWCFAPYLFNWLEWGCFD